MREGEEIELRSCWVVTLEAAPATLLDRLLILPSSLLDFGESGFVSGFVSGFFSGFVSGFGSDLIVDLFSGKLAENRDRASEYFPGLQFFSPEGFPSRDFVSVMPIVFCGSPSVSSRGDFRGDFRGVKVGNSAEQEDHEKSSEEPDWRGSRGRGDTDDEGEAWRGEEEEEESASEPEELEEEEKDEKSKSRSLSIFGNTESFSLLGLELELCFRGLLTDFADCRISFFGALSSEFSVEVFQSEKEEDSEIPAKFTPLGKSMSQESVLSELSESRVAESPPSLFLLHGVASSKKARRSPKKEGLCRTGSTSWSFGKK
jgi:hypothetical protein